MSKTRVRYGAAGAALGARITPQTLGALDLGPGVPLSSGQNLDEFITPGSYYCTGAAVAAAITSAPGSFPFKLLVMAARPGAVLQVAVRGTAAATIHIRHYSGSTWSAWRTLTPAT